MVGAGPGAKAIAPAIIIDAVPAAIIAVLSLILLGLGIAPDRAPDFPAWRFGLDASGRETRMVLTPPKALYYDLSGRLTQVDIDTNGDQRPDVIGFFSGADRPTRAAIDANFDGKIDRWEEYDGDGRTVRMSTSEKGGKADRFVEIDPSTGRPRVVEFDADQDGRKERREIYGAAGLERIEFDTNGDGRFDRAQVWRAGAVVAEEIDQDGDGRMDIRLTRLKDGSVRVERLEARA